MHRYKHKCMFEKNSILVFHNVLKIQSFKFDSCFNMNARNKCTQEKI